MIVLAVMIRQVLSWASPVHGFSSLGESSYETRDMLVGKVILKPC